MTTNAADVSLLKLFTCEIMQDEMHQMAGVQGGPRNICKHIQKSSGGHRLQNQPNHNMNRQEISEHLHWAWRLHGMAPHKSDQLQALKQVEGHIPIICKKPQGVAGFQMSQPR